MGSITNKLKVNGKGSNTPKEKWESALSHISPKNANSYRKELTRFSEWLELDLQQLYELGIEAQTADTPEDRLIVNDKLTEYLDRQLLIPSEKDGKSKVGYGKLKEIKTAIFKFYAVNGISLTLDKNSELGNLLKRKQTDKRKPTKTEIKNLIANSPNFRLKAVICMGKDTGLRCSDLIQIQFKHIQDGLESVDQFGGFLLKTEKTEKVALPCYGPESVYYLKLWISEMEKDLGRALTDNDYIFPTVMNYGNTVKYTKLDAGTLDQLINNQFSKMGLKGVLSANGLRYFFQSQLENELNKNLILKLQGKTISDSSSAYSKHDVEELLIKYKSAYHLLTVESGDHSQKAEITSMQTQIDNLKAELSKALNHIGEMETDKPEPEITEPSQEKITVQLTPDQLKKLQEMLGVQ